ncbi:MAG: hypothetical protein ACRD3D_17385 [Terriglobia bacterium]
MPTQTAVCPSTIERTLADVEEWHRRVQAIHKKMRRARSGSPAWTDSLAPMSVELNWLKEKIQSALNVVEEYLDALDEKIIGG